MPDKIKISVIIPTRNRAPQVEVCVLTLTNQTLPKEEYEVVIVDDGSTDDTVERLLPYKDKINLTIVQTHRTDPSFRAALVRNIGAKHAKGEILFFIDSDIIADPDLLKEHLKSYFEEQLKSAEEKREISVIGYRFHLRRDFHHILRHLIRQKKFDSIPYLPMQVDAREGGYRYYKIKDIDEFPAPWRFYHSNNISMSKEIFEKVGGFAEDFTGWGNEDIELGYRLWKAGVKLVLNRSAVGVHLDHPFDSKTRVDAIIENNNKFLLKHKDINVELYNDFLISAEAIIPEIYSLEEIKKSFGLKRENKDPKILSFDSSTTIILLGLAEDIKIEGKVEVAVDLREKCLDAYQGKGLKLNLVGYNLPFPEDAYDTVVINNYLHLFSDFVIFRIIAQAIRLAKRVLILEDKKIMPKIIKIVNSFSCREVKVRKVAFGEEEGLEIEKTPLPKSNKNAVGLMLIPMLSDYLLTTIHFADFSENKHEEIRWREYLLENLDKHSKAYIFINPRHFQECFEKSPYDFRKFTGKTWLWFRREERMPEEEGIHIYPGTQTTYWRPGINVKWFTKWEHTYRPNKSGKNRYNFFVDANIYSNKKQEHDAKKYGIGKEKSIILPPLGDDYHILLMFESYQSGSKKLLGLLNLLKKKGKGKLNCKFHIFCAWEEDIFQKRLPPLDEKKDSWQKYMRSFSLAYGAKKEEQMKKIKKLAEIINKKKLASDVNFYLVDTKDLGDLPRENFILADMLDKKKMAEIADNMPIRSSQKDEWGERLNKFLLSIKLDKETLAIKNCCFFLLAENFDKAASFMKDIKNDAYRDAFSIIINVENEKFQEALNSFEAIGKSIKSLPMFVKSHVYSKIAVAYFEIGKLPLAFKYWKKALAIDEDNHLARMSLLFKSFLK